MANRTFSKDAVTLEKGVVKLFGHVVTTTSGTIGSQSCKGFSIVKTATETGRYTVTLDDYYVAFLNASVVVVGSADTLYTTTKGLGSLLRNVAIDASHKTFDVQFVDRATAPADADLESSAEFYIEITLKNSSVY